MAEKLSRIRVDKSDQIEETTAYAEVLYDPSLNLKATRDDRGLHLPFTKRQVNVSLRRTPAGSTLPEDLATTTVDARWMRQAVKKGRDKLQPMIDITTMGAILGEIRLFSNGTIALADIQDKNGHNTDEYISAYTDEKFHLPFTKQDVTVSLNRRESTIGVTEGTLVVDLKPPTELDTTTLKTRTIEEAIRKAARKFRSPKPNLYRVK